MELIFGIEFGSTHITIYKKDESIRREIAVIERVKDEKTGDYIYGNYGRNLLDSDDALKENLVYPISNGVVTDKEALKELLDRIFRYSFPKRKFLASIIFYVAAECGLSVEEYNDYREVCYAIGVDKVFFVPAALCILNSLGLNNRRDGYYAIADIGADTTKFYIVKGNHVIDGLSISFAGNTLNSFIKQYAYDELNCIINDDQAVYLKLNCMSLIETDNASNNLMCLDVNRRPIEKRFTAQDFKGVMNGFFGVIADSIKKLIEKNQAYEASVKNNELILCGGTSKFYGIDRFFENTLGMRVKTNTNDDIITSGLEVLIDENRIVEVVG